MNIIQNLTRLPIRLIALTLLSFYLACCVCHSVLAQGRVELKRVEVSGKIAEYIPDLNQIRIQTENGSYLADISQTRRVPGGGILDMPPPTIRVVGQTSASKLERLSLVRFEAEIERFRFSMDKVDEITVFSETPFTRLGFLDPPAPEMDDPELAAKLAEDEKDEKKNKYKRRYLVSGLLDSHRNGFITVIVPHDGDERKVKVPVSPDAIVSYELNGIRFASIGNRITAKGETIVAGDRPFTFFFAQDVEIEITPDKRLVEIQRKKKESMTAAGEDGSTDPAEGEKPEMNGGDPMVADVNTKPVDGVKDPNDREPKMGAGGFPVADARDVSPFGAAPDTKDASKPETPTNRRPRRKPGKVVKIN